MKYYHLCDSCGSEFSVYYDESAIEDYLPSYCPFCGEMMDYEENEDD